MPSSPEAWVVRPVGSRGTRRYRCRNLIFVPTRRTEIQDVYVVHCVRFDGYSFRIIAEDKVGFTIVATPVTYGDSGIMTIVLSKGGKIYQKDLGPNSVSNASYNPNDGWTPAE